MRQRVIELVREVLGVEPFVTIRENTAYVRSGQPQVVRFFERFGYPRGRKARTVVVPQAILRSTDLECVRAFLNGLFSTDGSFSFSGIRASCALSVASSELRNGFVSLASRFDFEFHVYSYSHRTGKNEVPLNLAVLSKREEVRRWMDTVGSICDAHEKRYSMWKQCLSKSGNALSA